MGKVEAERWCGYIYILLYKCKEQAKATFNNLFKNQC